MGGREFLDYIYDEITAKILEYLRTLVIQRVMTAPNSSSANAIGVPKEPGEPSLSIVAQALGGLSDVADDITIVMNRRTHALFVAEMAENGYMFDPFMGYRVRYSNALPVYTNNLTSNDIWLVVGDLRAVQANFPNGDDVKLKLDDLTDAEADLVKIVGRLPVAVGITAPGRIVAVTGNGNGGGDQS